MDDPDCRFNDQPNHGQDGRHQHGMADAEWLEAMTRTLAHLAAQLTMSQIRLRALATELADRGAVDEAAVRTRVHGIAEAEAGTYLRANLGEALAAVIDVEALERDIVAFMIADRA